MSDQSPLIVPIVVEAFVVNDHVRRTGEFYRAEMQYNDIQDLSNGGLAPDEPNFIDKTNPQWSKYYNGVYLKWRLPDAFTRGLTDGVMCAPKFPLVPNRWLVVRYTPFSVGTPTAWIVESDYLWPLTGNGPDNLSQVGSMYLQAASPTDDTPVGVNIGRNVRLDGDSVWTESGHCLKLTAVAPGNPAFAYYQPACNNVFSLMDPLYGYTPDPDTLSYQVFGWFSSPADDPLAKVDEKCDFSCLLEKLGWQLAKETNPTLTAAWSLMCGMVTGVKWETASIPPGGAPSPTAPVSVAVGNTTTEALTALIAGQGGAAIDTDLLEAFQLGLVDVLDKSDGSAGLSDVVHTSFFQKFTGGYIWEIVDAPSNQFAPLSVNQQELHKELEKELQWLAVLNQNQERLDQARRTLADLQRQLYVMWWKYVNYVSQEPVSTDIENLNQTTLAQQLDPSVEGSLANQVTQLKEIVKSLASPYVVPTGDTPAALQSAIDLFVSAQKLPPNRVLKRASAPVFFEPNNPVTLIAGAGASGIVPRQPTLRCRFPSQTITGFQCRSKSGTTKITAATPNLAIPIPSLAPLTGVSWLSTDLPKKLFQEFFLLDPNNAAAIATATGLKVEDVQTAMEQSASYDGMGILPVAVDAPWKTNPWKWEQNPWHPLLLLYQAYYYPIVYGTREQANWTFADGKYTWNGNGADPLNSVVGLSGVLQLTPAAAFNMQSRIEAFLRNNRDLDSKTAQEFNELLKFVQSNDNWDLLSQALDGFNQQLLLNLPGTWLGPGTSADPPHLNTVLPKLIGPGHGSPPGLGNIPQTVPSGSAFLPWRCGQFIFTNLRVVDEWGQAVQPIDGNNYTTQTIYQPPEMTPEIKVFPNTSDPLVQFTPALLQPGRLDFDLVSATNDNDRIGLTPNANPISGWVLPNHLDASLMAYDTQGHALGEMSIGVTSKDQQAVCWVDAPNSPYSGLDQINAAIKHFGPFLWNLNQQGPATFAAFLEAIDETLWTTLPLGEVFDQGLTALIGRPLAMVRSRLQFELNGPPYEDPSWQYTFSPVTPAVVTGYKFAIELGNVAQLEDGLIGYFRDNDYTRFNVVSNSGSAAGRYLKPIGANNNYIYLPFDGKSSEFVSMLIDPRAAVHARTGILPTLALELAPQWTSNALAAMNVTFRVDGILTDSHTVALPEAPTTVLLPVPHEKHGTWIWVENDDGHWQQYATAPNDTTARLANTLPVLRRGFLQLSDARAARSTGHLPPNRRIEKIK